MNLICRPWANAGRFTRIDKCADGFNIRNREFPIMDRFLGMKLFVPAVNLGSFTAAARTSRLTAPMIGKHIRSLEERLGSRLLIRATRRQQLTEIGRAYYTRCKSILHEVEAADLA